MSVDVYVHPDTVDITFGGLDRFLCFHDRIILPMDEIVSARVLQVESAAVDRGWRLLGGYWPGRVTTGHYAARGLPGRRHLWCVYRDAEVLVVETSQRRLSKVVLQHPDRHNLAWLIGERITPAD